MNNEGRSLSSPPLPLPSFSSPPIFFSPTSSSSIDILISPSPSPSSSSSSSSSSPSLPKAALVGSGLAGAVVATALVATIATKMGCSFLPPLLSLLSFLFKKVLGAQHCADVFTICGRKRSRRKSSSLDYDRDDSNGRGSISRRPLSPSTRPRHDRRYRVDHRYRDDVAIEVWEELDGARNQLHDQVNDVGHLLRPTKSNISKFAASEMRKLEGNHGINIHDTTLVINKNLKESHDHIHTVNLSVEEFEVAMIERSKSNVDSSSSAVALDQMNELRTHEITQRFQSEETSNDCADEGDQIDNQLRDGSNRHDNSPSTSRPEGNKLRKETTEAPPTARFKSDGPLIETRRNRLDHPKSQILAPSKASVSGNPPEFARNPRRRPVDLQIVTSDQNGTRNRFHDSVHADSSRKTPTTRRPNKRRRLSKVAGVRVSCELSAHFWKLFVFCKTGTNYGADNKKEVDGGDSSGRRHGISDSRDSSPPSPRVSDDRDLSTRQNPTVPDGTLEKPPYSVHFPSMPSRAMEVPPPFLPIQFYQQPSVWQPYPAPPRIVTSGGEVSTAAYYTPLHIHGQYSSEAVVPESSMASAANSSVPQSSAAMVPMPEAKIRPHYNSPYVLVPIVNTAAGNYIINGGGGTYASTVAMIAPTPMQHHVTISKNTAANSSMNTSDTNSMTDDVEDLAEQSATSNHQEKATSEMPTTSAHSSSTDSKKGTVQQHEFGTPLYGV